MAVFNLLAGTCDMLPPLKLKRTNRAIGAAVLTGADCSSNIKHGHSSSSGYRPAALFRLVIIKTDAFARPRKVYVFTSGQASWSTLRKFSIDDQEIGSLMHPNGVVCRGRAYWLVQHTGFHILDVDVETCHVSLTEIPILAKHVLARKTHDGPHLSVNASGTLSVLHLRRQDRKSTRLNSSHPV